MVLAASLVSLLVLGPPAPTLAPDPEAPTIEGPAAPPGIEFAKPPPTDDDDDNDDDDDAPFSRDAIEGTDPDEFAADDPFHPEPSWPTPGTAPANGMGGITSGAILIPSAALVGWALYDGAQRRADRVAVITVSSALGAMGIGLIGMGLYRNAKLHRWTLAYRVRATPQGGGLLAAGSIALSFGAALAGSGIVAFARGDAQIGGILLGTGVTSLVIAPLTLVYGKRRRDRYLRTGGWYRPPLPLPPTATPTVRFAPILTPTSAGVGVQGQF
jgi:hypothetical protein